MNIGWGKQIKETLNNYDLPTDLATIKTIHPLEWKRQVKRAIEKRNLERLKEECHKEVDGIQTEKTKTKTIVNHLNDPYYTRKIQTEILNATKQETKSTIIARYKMLKCGNNFKGALSQLCNQCNCIDDENHRLNYCVKWRNVNLYNSVDKVDMDVLYNGNMNELRPIISNIEKVWNVKNAHGTMNVL